MLALDIGKFPGKIRPISDENCFTNNTVMQSEVKKIISFQCFKNHRYQRYVKSLFTNIQKQYNTLKISLPFKKFNQICG